MMEYVKNPRPAAVYNIGGGKANSCSIMEAFKLVESFTGKPMMSEYVSENRIGDHICYYSDLRKAMTDYPDWRITIPLDRIFEEIAENWLTHRKLS